MVSERLAGLVLEFIKLPKEVQDQIWEPRWDWFAGGISALAIPCHPSEGDTTEAKLKSIINQAKESNPSLRVPFIRLVVKGITWFIFDARTMNIGLIQRMEETFPQHIIVPGHINGEPLNIGHLETAAQKFASSTPPQEEQITFEEMTQLPVGSIVTLELSGIKEPVMAEILEQSVEPRLSRKRIKVMFVKTGTCLKYAEGKEFWVAPSSLNEALSAYWVESSTEMSIGYSVSSIKLTKNPLRG